MRPNSNKSIKPSFCLGNPPMSSNSSHEHDIFDVLFALSFANGQEFIGQQIIDLVGVCHEKPLFV